MKKALWLFLAIFIVGSVAWVSMGELDRSETVAADSFKICLKVPDNCLSASEPMAYGDDKPTDEVRDRLFDDFSSACKKSNVRVSLSMWHGMFVHDYECSSTQKYVFRVYVSYGINVGNFHAVPWHMGVWAPCGDNCTAAKSAMDETYEIELGRYEEHQWLKN